MITREQAVAQDVKLLRVIRLPDQARRYILRVTITSHLLREALGNLEARLDAKKFLRIHRSTIVNLERIQELESWFHNEYRVILRDGTKLMMSRSCRKRLGEFLGSQV